MTDADKPSFIERIGERIGERVGIAPDGDAAKIAARRDGERRLQTYMMGIVVAVVAGLAISVVTTFAVLPGQIKVLVADVGAARNESAATLARIEHRIDAGDGKDIEHDSDLVDLAQRVARSEYVLAIAPATAQYAAAAKMPTPAPKKPASSHGKAIVPKPPKGAHDDQR